MPFSESSLLSPLMAKIEELDPKTVLDVGVGFGQYGVLCRNNLEHINLFEWDDKWARKREKHEWQVQIVGIEAFTDYISPVHDYVYDQVLIGDAMDILPKLTQSFDLVLAVEILEHLDKDQGRLFLEHLKRVTEGHLIVTTPKEFIPQDYPANPYENHRSLWAREELEAAGFQTFIDDPGSWIAVMAASATI